MTREYGTALIAGVLGGIAIIVAFGATWTVATVPIFEGQSTPTTQIALSGRTLVPLGAAAGWVVLASVGGIIATRRLGRRLIGGVMALAAGVAGTAAATAAATYAALAISSASGPGAPATEVSGLRPWWLLALVGALAGVVAGALAIGRGTRWPALGRRYERAEGAAPPAPGPVPHPEAATPDAPSGRSSAPEAPEAPDAPEALDALESWDALDRGVDPTVDPTVDPIVDPQPRE